MGVPASGKTTISRLLAEHYEIQLVHGSRIVIEACPGDWIKQGMMAPEPCATLAITEELAKYPQWILDGFPRTEYQIPAIEYEPVVFLELSNPMALKRAIRRGRMSKEIEEYRIREQSRLLAPVRNIAAVTVPVAGRTPQQILTTILDWYERDIHP